jgi:hypothetical protein
MQKVLILSGYFLAASVLSPGTIQLTQKTITNEKILVRIGYWRFRRL